MIVSVFQSKCALSADDVRSLPRQSISSSWEHVPLSYPFSWSLALDPATMWLCCSLPGGGTVKSGSARGDFVEGLWEYDVAELFVRDARGAYQEFNVSPTGAWWSMTHTEYRVRSNDSRPARCLSVTTKVFDGQWEVVAAFERNRCRFPLRRGAFFM